MNQIRRIAIVGGGPSGLFMYKRLIESNIQPNEIEIDIFESNKCLGAGMPYSGDGANLEHVTNVSDHEIPELVTSIEAWIRTVPESMLAEFGIELARFNEYKVLPRLLFGKYLSAQFDLLIRQADKMNIKTQVYLGSRVIDMKDHPAQQQVEIFVNGPESYRYDHAIICTGHKWPVKYEGQVPGYFDSPYPPHKLERKVNHAVAIKGSSLTAIDAIKTLARYHGQFQEDVNGHLCFIPAADCPEFKMVMHSRNGLLPAVRIHLEDPMVEDVTLLTKEQIHEQMTQNEGFLSLDFVFEKNFKDTFKTKDPIFYERIKDMTLENFVEWMMHLRENLEPFQLLRVEYVEAEKSIRSKESIHWKEMLGVLSFALNYPAKHLSAEDMLRLQKVLMPLISIVIAFVPQGSCKELMALHDAGKLDLISVGSESNIQVEKTGGVTFKYNANAVFYNTFIDCTGQTHFSYEEFPFKSMLKMKTVSPAYIKFQSQSGAKESLEKAAKDVESDAVGNYYLRVPGVKVNDYFQVVGEDELGNNRIYLMAVPYMGGYNPDYSGLDFCAEASSVIVQQLYPDSSVKNDYQ